MNFCNPMVKMSLEQLLVIQDMLDTALVSGDISYDKYVRDWDDVLIVSGYTNDDYKRAIDERWDRVEFLRKHKVPIFASA